MSGDESTPPAKGRLSWIGMTLVIANVMAAVLCGFLYIRYGSLSRGLAYLKGERIFPDTYSKSFGQLDVGQSRLVTFHLTNMTDSSIALNGSKLTCTCATVSGLPVVIPPAQARPVSIRVRPKQPRGDVVETVSIYTNSPTQPRVVMSIYGRMAASSSETAR